MTDRTSISVTEDLKAELDSLKTHEQQSYENLLWELIDESEVDNTKSELDNPAKNSAQVVRLEATEYKRIAEEVSEELKR